PINAPYKGNIFCLLYTSRCV
ncbi:hypothetical protein A5871_003058, partial [Enterococcus sp. 2F9_DIV0599]